MPISLYLASLSSRYLKELETVAEQDLAAEEVPELVKRGIEKVRKARKRLVETNLKLVIWVAKRYGGLPLMDKIQEGNIGLMRAAERFDFRRGVNFHLRGLVDQTGHHARQCRHLQDNSSARSYGR